MRIVLAYILVAYAITCIHAQIDSTLEAGLRRTEVHAGIAFPKLFHAGVRFAGKSLMVEFDLGSAVIFPNASYALGLGYIPEATSKNPGLYYSLQYAVWSGDFPTPTERFLTANIGWLDQHIRGFSFLARAGLGIARHDYGSSFPPEYNLRPNLELEMGYAF